MIDKTTKQKKFIPSLGFPSTGPVTKPVQKNLMVAHGNITHPIGIRCKFCEDLLRETKWHIQLFKLLTKLNEDDYYKAFNLVEDIISQTKEEETKRVVAEIDKRMFDYSAQGETTDKVAFFALYNLKELLNKKK